MDLKSTQLKDTYGNLLTIGTTAGSPQTGTLQNGDGEDITTLDIAGTITADGLTVTKGSVGQVASFSGDDVGGARALQVITSTTTNTGDTHSINAQSSTGILKLSTNNNTERLSIFPTGDISFRDGATNEAFYWDASTARLGLGTTSPAEPFDLQMDSISGLKIGTNADGGATLTTYQGSNNSNVRQFQINCQNFEVNTGSPTGTSTSNALLIDSSGNVGIGTTSPQGELDVQGGINTTFILGTGSNTPNSVQSIEFKDRYGASGFPNGQIGSFIKQERDGSSAIYDLVFGTANTTVSDATERMRILSSGGITFNGDTATANALDDYEEGTFTPTIAFGGGSTGVTYTNASGYYTKIGNIVHFTALIDLSSKGTDTGDVTIGGLPFTATHASGRFPDVNTRVIQNVVVDTFLQSAVLNNTTTVGILQYNSTTDDQEYLTDADFSNNSELNVTGFYFT